MPGYSAARGRKASERLLYRAEEAAVMMGISRTAVFGLIRSGDLDTIQIGHRRRIPRQCIDDYIARQLTRTDTPEAF